MKYAKNSIKNYYMKLSQAILISLSILICFSQALYSSEPASSSIVTQFGPITRQQYLSNLIEESYKKVGLQKTFKLLNELKEKVKNDVELTTDLDAIINKIIIKKSIKEYITFPPELSKKILSFVNPFDEFDSFKTFDQEIQKLAWSPDGIHLAIIYSQDNKIIILNTETQEIKTLTGHTANVEKIAWSTDSLTLASSAQQTIKIWDITTGQNIKESGADMAVSSIAFSPDGKYFASADWHGKVFIWDANTFNLLKSFNTVNTGGNWITDICWSPDSNFLAYSDFYFHNKIDLFDINSGSHRTLNYRSVRGYRPKRFHSIQWSKDGKYIFTGNDGYPNKFICKLSDFQNADSCDMQKMLVIDDHYIRELDGTYDDSSVFNICCSYDSKMFATRSGAGIINIWDIETKTLIQNLPNKNKEITSIDFSPVANILAVGCKNGEIKLYGQTLG